jgi:hypothetical protein
MAARLFDQGVRHHTFVAISATPLDLLCEASKVYNTRIIVSINIQKLNPRAEVVHQLPQGPRGDSPVVCGLGFVKLGVCWSFWLESQRVRGRDAWEKYNVRTTTPLVSPMGDYQPFLQVTLAMRRLFFLGPSSMATSHRSITDSLLAPSPPLWRALKTDRSDWDRVSVRKSSNKT